MKTKTASSSKSIEERLNDYPELKAKIEGLISVVENAEAGRFHFRRGYVGKD
jgi:hypothetical protein